MPFDLWTSKTVLEQRFASYLIIWQIKYVTFCSTNSCHGLLWHSSCVWNFHRRRFIMQAKKCYSKLHYARNCLYTMESRIWAQRAIHSWCWHRWRRVSEEPNCTNTIYRCPDCAKVATRRRDWICWRCLEFQLKVVRWRESSRGYPQPTWQPATRALANFPRIGRR